jgi:hypothetical protein
MRSLLLAVALALGIGFVATGAQAAAVGGNVAAIQSVAKSGNSVVEKTYYRRRYWRHRYYRRHYWRPYYGYYGYRPYYGYGYRHRYWRRHHYYRYY